RINIGGHIFGKDRSIFDHTWTLSKDYRLIHGNRQFIKSLTFNEPFKYQVNCDHTYYRVPVKVVKKTDTGGELPVPGSSLSVAPSFRHSDKLVANRITDDDGKTVIYLPDQGTTVAAHHKDGDAIYSGYAQANPQDIRSNKEVKIILSHDSDQKKTIQVRKKWEIDLEDLDRPDSVMVVIEKRNNVTKRWDIYEYEELGKKRLAVGILTKNDWIWEKSGLPMFSDGQRNDYRVREVADGVTYSDTEYEGLTEEQKTAKRKQIREKIIYDTFDYLDLGGEDPAPLTTNTVTYPVKAYTTLTGEYVPAHTTKYDVAYNGPVPYNSSDDELWTVTNTAVYDAEISKRFIVPAGEALPSEVYLSLLAKPKDGWSEAADRKGIFTGQLLVSSPRAGGMTILELEDAHVLNGQPIAGFERLSLAVGRAHSGNDYKVRFTVDKYQNGIPMDFFCTEFNTDDLHWMFLNRYHVDVYADVYSDNDFTVIQGGAYPLLGNDTLLVGNVINVYSEDEDARYIGGTKYWVNSPDSELQKIDHILIHIKDENGNEIQGSPVKVRREDNLKTNPDGSTEVMNAWVWACKIPEENHTYKITEEFPAEYTEGDSWFPLVIRNDVINIWTGTAPRKVRIQKFFDSFFDENYIIGDTHNQDVFIIKLVSNETEKYALSLTKDKISAGTLFSDFEDSGRWTDLLGYTLTETIDNVNSSHFIPVKSAPVLIFENGTPILVFAVTNRYQLMYKFEVQKSWKPEGSAPSGSLKVTIKESTGSASGTEFQLDPPWQQTEPSFTHPRLDAKGIPYLYFPEEELEEFRLSWTSTESIPDPSNRNERLLTFTLTNEKKADNPDCVTFTVTKKWTENGKKELRPENVRYSVIGIDDLDNYHYMDTRDCSKDALRDEQTITFTGLPRLDPYGVAYSYFVLENDVPGYTAKYIDPVQDTNGNWTQTIENTLTGDCEIILQKRLTNKIDTDPSETFTFQFDPPTDKQGNNYPMPIEWIQATETGGKLKIQDAGVLTLHFPINRAGTYYFRLYEIEPEESERVPRLTYDTTPRMLFIEAEWNAGQMTYTSGVKLCDSADAFDKNQDHYVKTDRVVFNNIYEARKDIPVEKKWDIDLERKDKPNEIWVALQSMRHNMVSRYFEKVTNQQLMWKTEAVLKLDASNNWQGKFEGMPVYDVDAEGKLHEIQYRVRELREGEDNPDPETLPNTRIVHAKEDTDQITVKYLKKMGIIEINEVWQFILNGLAGWIIPEDFVYESPMVVYTVPAYQTIRGEREEEHQTKYDVKYETAEGLTRITNTAILETNIYKRWINFKDGEKPDSVYLTLMGRVREEYRELVPPELKNLAGTYIPVINPLTHGMTLLDIVGIRIPEGLDAGIPSLSLAIAKAKDDSSFLKAWHVDFKIKKYSLFGLPMEYEGAELSSGILKSLVKAITGLDFPISISLPGGYVSIPGKAYCIPILNKDWELTSNVFNIKGNIDPDPTPTPTPSPKPTPTPSGQPFPPTLPPPTLSPVPTFSPPTPTNTPTASPDRTPTPTPKNRTIVGVKYWINDKAENRPEWIKIHVFKGAVEIQGSPVELKKNSFNFGTENSPMWPWAIVTKDAGPDSAYRIEEEFPEGYDQYQHYRRVKNGLDLYNIWLNPEKTPEVQVRKVWEGTAPGTNAAATVKMEYGQGSTLTFNLNKQNNYVQATSKPTDMNIDQVRITETTYSGVDDKKYVPSYSGPSLSIRTDGTPVYTFTVTNHLRENLKIVVEKEWKGDRTAQRPRNLGVRIIRRAPDGTVTKIPFDLTENYLVSGSENRWRRESTPEEGEQFPEVDNQGKRYNYSIEEDEVPGYRMRVRFSQDGNTLTFYLENTWIPVEETVTVQGEKFWVDDEDAFGIRPETIQIVVMNSRYEQVRTMTIPSDQARWHVPNLPRYDENGTELKYFVLEGECENYTTTYPTPTFDEATRTWTCDVYNAFVARKKVTVDKSWSPVGIEHPQSLAVYLYAGDQIRESVYLTPANHWRKVFDDLPVMDGSGSEIAYRIEEDTPEGYTESSYSEYEDLDEYFYLENAKEQNGILAIPVEKMVVGGIPPSGEKEVFKIKMTFLGGSKENPAEVPMPVSDTVEITNKGMANFQLPYSEKHADGLYMYSLQEIPGNNKNYHYDSRVA
ncbi:MAG: Cna B-type domain-containing protein, partial [Clostridia bacterium]|nr:Cna B-type domain-containing protein [Clostridia bacterium]